MKTSFFLKETFYLMLFIYFNKHSYLKCYQVLVGDHKLRIEAQDSILKIIIPYNMPEIYKGDFIDFCKIFTKFDQ